MSITLPVVDLSAAVVNTSGTVTWIQQTGAISSQATNNNPATLWIFNESGCGLQLSMQSGDRPFLPAGGWIDMQLTPNCMAYDYKVLYVIGGAQVNSLVTVWFAPGESVPNVPRLGNSPIGGSLTNNVSNSLQGVGQSGSLTEQDIPFVAGQPNNAALVPTTPNSILSLAARDNANNRAVGIDINPDLTNDFYGRTKFYNGQSVFGQGLVPIVAAVLDFQTTTTGLKTVLSFTVGAANGLFRINWSVKVANAISGNNITAQVVFTDTSNASQTKNLNAASGGGATNTQGFIGSNSIVNGWYPGLSEMIGCKAATSITISYNDPTNTPNDFISAVIEQLL